MLEGLGLLVDILPVHFQNLNEKGLDQPVLAQDRQRISAPRRSQADTLPGLMLEEALSSHGFHHGGDRSRSDSKRFGDYSGRYDGVAVTGSNEDGLKIVFNSA